MSIAISRPPVQARRSSRHSRLARAAAKAVANYHAALLLDHSAAERVVSERSREAAFARDETDAILARARHDLLRAILAFSPNYASDRTLYTRHENRAVRLGNAVYIAAYADGYDLAIGESYQGCHVMRLRVVPGRAKRDLNRIDAVIVDIRAGA